jgi:hypothetical protein
MPEGNQDHRSVALTIAAGVIGTGGLDEPLDFRLGQMLSRPDFRIRPSLRRNCPICSGGGCPTRHRKYLSHRGLPGFSVPTIVINGTVYEDLIGKQHRLRGTA